MRYCPKILSSGSVGTKIISQLNICKNTLLNKAEDGDLGEI